ncbi:MAG: hypothetical protein WC565_04050 [Parcubacteria group bacterium]|jgi:hypothetical protein
MIFKIWDDEAEPVEVEASSIESAVLHWLDDEQNDEVRDDIIANGAEVMVRIDDGETFQYRVNYELSASVRRL